MALADGGTVTLRGDNDCHIFKISENKIVGTSVNDTPSWVTMDGSSIAVQHTGTAFGYILAQFAYQELPYSNRVLAIGLNTSNEWYIILTDWDVNVNGTYNVYLSSRIDDVVPSGIFDAFGFAMTSTTEGYAVVWNGIDETGWYLILFSVSGNTITIDSITNIAAASTTQRPSAAIGLGNGAAVQFWEKDITGTTYLYYDIVTQGAVGTPVNSWVPSDSDDAPFSSGSSLDYINMKADHYSSNMIIFAINKWTRLLRYAPTVLVGTPEKDDASYPPDTAFMTDAAALTVGLGGIGLFAWKFTAGTGNAYVAELTYDPTTGALTVNQTTRIATNTVNHYRGLFPMVDGFEAALVYYETLGAASLQVQRITGLGGYTEPPFASDTGKRMWIYKTLNDGVSWVSRGLKITT